AEGSGGRNHAGGGHPGHQDVGSNEPSESGAMPTFAYKARTSEGKLVEGVLTAENETAALRALDERSLFAVQMREGHAALRSAAPGRVRRVRLRRLAAMYSQLADLLRAGVPVLRALDVLCRQNANPALTQILREVREDVASGQSLAEAMTKHPQVFSELHVAMIRAGERGAFLEEVLQRIATFTERQNELRNKLAGSLIYPCILVTVGTAVVLILLTFMVPQIRPFLEGRPLPVTTTAVFAACDFLRSNLAYLGLGLLMVPLPLVAYVRTERGRRRLDRFKLQAPLVGRIYTMVAICRFCRILGTMLANGVPILQALRISKKSTGNGILEEVIEQATENVRKGEPLAPPLSRSGYFPPDIVEMIAVGEESNNLENVLVHIADSNEVRTGRVIDLAVRILEPALLVMIAGVVLLIAQALLVPILTLGSSGLVAR
ncbi:MAG: type II secretion system F family protein, partial [Phycisphaerae bacterium]